MDGETNIVSQNQPTVNAPEPPVSVETQPTNTNTSAGTENTAERQQAPNGGMGFKLVEKNGERVVEIIENQPSAEETQQNEPPADNQPVENTETSDESTEPAENVDGGEAEQPTVTETAEQIGEELNATPAPYSIEELAQAISSGQVDPGRVPEAYKAQYESWRLNEAVRAYNAQRQAEHQRQQAELAKQQLTPEQQQAQMKEFLHNVDSEASRRAAQDAGLTMDEVSNLDLIDDDDDRKIAYKMAKEWRRAEINQTLQQKYLEENAKRQQQAAVYQAINDFTAQAKASEPHFDEINRLMATRVNDLSYKRAVEIVPVLQALQAGTITEAQSLTLRNYYEDTRKAFYASKNNLSTKPKAVKQPPIVEKPGNGAQLKKEYKPDYSALRAADARGRMDWMREFVKNL